MKTGSLSDKLDLAQSTLMEDTVDHDDDYDNAATIEDDDTSDDEPAPSKKRRLSRGNESSKAPDSPRSKGKGKGKMKVYRGRNVGKLAKLLEMPMDIFCEITVYLEPLDLLRLARSTRGLNNMLMSRTSKPIWRTARNYYPGLPDCPPDLSEPEYARLIFERDCHACLKPRVMKVDFKLRLRMCRRCQPANIVQGTQLMESIPDLTQELLECIPHRNQHWSGEANFGTLDYFYCLQVERVVAKFREAVPQGTPAAEAEDLKKAFYDHTKGLMENIFEHTSAIKTWLLTDRRARIKEVQDAAVRRRANIIEKLGELGYSQNDFPVAGEDGAGGWNQIMDQPRDLTPRIWANVRPKLEAYIQNVKRGRGEHTQGQRQA